MLRNLVKSFRVKQWLKNGFVFAGLLFDGQLFNSIPFARTLIGFVIFSFVTSSVYLVNDMIDINADKNHPLKRYRPLAAGKITITQAIIAAIILTIISLSGAYYLSSTFFIICGFYLVINLFYSKWLKHIPILDVMIIALGFVLRVAGGVSLITVKRFSPWLYVLTTLLALYIGFGKRRAELVLLEGNANQHRSVLEGYTLGFLDQLITIVSSTTIAAYCLYTFSTPGISEGYAMMLTIPFVMFGIFRYLYLLQVQQAGGAPEEILLQDRPLQITVLLYGISILIISYLI